jgi:hypothetical protein
MTTDKTYRFLLWEPTTGDRVIVNSNMRTFSEAVSAAYIRQKELMHSTSKNYRIVGALEVDAVSKIGDNSLFSNILG